MISDLIRDDRDISGGTAVYLMEARPLGGKRESIKLLQGLAVLTLL